MPLIRVGFQHLLTEVQDERTVEVTTIADVEDLVPRCQELHPDVIVFELQPAADPAIATCRKLAPLARLVALHLGRRVDHLEHAQRLGAWLLSYAAAPEVARAVITGTNSGATRVIEVERRRSNRTLLPLEREVLRLAGEGYSCVEAAVKLGLPPDVVRRLADDARLTLGTGTLNGAVRRARAAGMVPSVRRAS